MNYKKLSIIIPVYNEEETILEIIKRVRKANIGKLQKEIIVINDASTDKTQKKLSTLKYKNIKVINKKKNQGKGAANRTGLQKAGGNINIIQDADLEYNPEEYKLLLEPILLGKADVVYGSRFVTTQARRVLYFWHSVGNSFLTITSNIFTNLNLSDMETCYKMFTEDVKKKIKIEEDRFGFEPEFTAKVAKENFRIYEVGISYSGRSYNEGKKIGWKDGLHAFWCIIKYNLIH